MLFDEEENLVIAQAAAFAGVLCLYALVKANNKRKKRRFKVRPINRTRRQGEAYQYYEKMKSWNPEQFFMYTRMTVPMFEKLLKKIKPKISRQKRSDGIPAEDRLVITLQYVIFQIYLTFSSKFNSLIIDSCLKDFPCKFWHLNLKLGTRQCIKLFTRLAKPSVTF